MPKNSGRCAWVFHPSFVVDDIESLRLRLLGVRLVECRTQTTRQCRRISVGPEMHKVEMWFIEEHVIVHGLDLDSMRAESAEHGIYFLGQHHKVTGDRRFPTAGWLEVDCGCCSHRRWNNHASISNLFGARDAELQNPSVDLARESEGVFNCLDIQINRRRRSRRD